MVAAEQFAASGAEVPLEQVARHAGVGIGTLYRHFPTREALIEAVYRREVAVLCDRAGRLLATKPPVEALRLWLRSFVTYVDTKRGMATALKAALAANTDLHAETHRRLSEAVTSLVRAGVESGDLRDDVDAMTLLRGVSGACTVNDDPGWKKRALAVVELLIDGMRCRY